jgi:hypothetical protein
MHTELHRAEANVRKLAAEIEKNHDQGSPYPEIADVLEAVLGLLSNQKLFVDVKMIADKILDPLAPAPAVTVKPALAPVSPPPPPLMVVKPVELKPVKLVEPKVLKPFKKEPVEIL